MEPFRAGESDLGESSKSAHADTWGHNQVLVAELPLPFLSLAFARELQRHTVLALLPALHQQSRILA